MEGREKVRIEYQEEPRSNQVCGKGGEDGWREVRVKKRRAREKEGDRVVGG